jgi:peptidoglycan/xylan/chitin deacetylase (PgdA/CDA1 family)
LLRSQFDRPKNMRIKIAILHLAKFLGLFALARVITRRSTRILCYHGGSLGDEHLFNPKLFCQPGLLEKRLKWLKKTGFVASHLNSLIETQANTRPSGIPLIVTLDDGWYSSSLQLLPCLANYGHRPVLYLATKVFAEQRPVVDVCIRYILWKSDLDSVCIEGLNAVIDGKYRLGIELERNRFCIAAERWLLLAEQDGENICRKLERIAESLNVRKEDLNLSSRRFSYMSKQELLDTFNRGCHIELHGHHHKYFAGEFQRNISDIEMCRELIMATGLPPPRHYCYPSGEYDADAPSALASAGVITAVTCVPGLAKYAEGDLRYFLPRFLDGADVTMIEFEAEMSGVLAFLRFLVNRPQRLFSRH